MTKPVLQILGGMLVDDSFRADMTATGADVVAVVQSYAYGPLTSAELDVTLNIVKSFKNGKMDGSVSAVRGECPDWPCN